jgi:hypothetical protein
MRTKQFADQVFAGFIHKTEDRAVAFFSFKFIFFKGAIHLTGLMLRSTYERAEITSNWRDRLSKDVAGIRRVVLVRRSMRFFHFPASLARRI